MPLSDQFPFNRLSNAEAERLTMLAEEAGEIVQAVGKILRHGYASCHPDNENADRDNRADLEKEIGDLIGIALAMVKADDLQQSSIDAAAGLKWIRAKPYTHHQDDEDA